MKTFQTLEKLESFLPIYSSQAALGSCIPPREGGNQVQDAGPPGWGGRGLGCAEGEPNAGCPPRWRAAPPPQPSMTEGHLGIRLGLDLG